MRSRARRTGVPPRTAAALCLCLGLVLPSPADAETPPAIVRTGPFQYMTPPAPSEDEQRDCPFNEPGLTPWEDVFGALTADAVAEGYYTLPNATKVLVGAADFARGAAVGFKQIAIPEGSELIFRDEPMSLTVNSILVFGKLRVGGPRCRMRSAIDIVFTGSRADPPTLLNGQGSKGIAVFFNGEMDLFGKRYYPTWTRLVRPAAAGGATLHLETPVSWEVGQEVLVVTTAADDTGRTRPHENEVRTIAAVDASRQVVTLTQPLFFDHYAGVEYQGEVALLSRSMSLAGEPDADGYGGHTIVFGKRGRIAGVASRYMGQTNFLGKYPFHFHRIGGGTGSYMTDNVVRDSYFRCYTIHGTSDVEVRENVAFNATGHCLYLEDGVETNVTIAHNLVAHVHPIGTAVVGATTDGELVYEDLDAGGLQSGERVLPADAAAMCYYISNADNIVEGNTASGGWAGFSYVSYPTPIGADRFSSYYPNTYPVQLFRGNVAHSTGWYWGWAAGVYVGGELTYTDATKTRLQYKSGFAARETLSVGGELVTSNFTDFLVWGARRGITHWGDRVNVERFEFYDVTTSATLHGAGAMGMGLVGITAARNPPAAYPDSLAERYYRDALNSSLTDGGVDSNASRGSGDGSAPGGCTLSTRAGFACMTEALDGMHLHWQWDGEAPTIRLAVTSPTQGWLAISFPEATGKMIPADALVLTEAGVRTYRLEDYSNVYADDTIVERIQLSATAGGWDAEGTAFEFTRSAEVFESLVAVNLARAAESRVLAQHVRADAAALTVDLKSGVTIQEEIEDLTDDRLIHSWLMILAWCYLAPAGILLKRYGKTVFGLGNSTVADKEVGLGSAVVTHIALLLIALALATTAFVIAVRKFRANNAGNTDSHDTMGYVVFGVMCALPLMGAMVPVLCPTPTGLGRTLFTIAHKWVGRAVVIVAYAQVYTGVKKMRDNNAEGYEALSHGAAVGVAVSVVLAMVFELQHRVYVVDFRSASESGPARYQKKRIRAEEVKIKHGQESEDPWIIVAGRVFAIQAWMNRHPGGKTVLMDVAGGDATDEWRMFRHSAAAMQKMEGFFMGEVEDSRMASSIDLAENITEALVTLDLTSAHAIIQRSRRDGAVPSTLLTNFQGLLKNLESYIPFLPQTLTATTSAMSGVADGTVTVEQARVAMAIESNPPTEVAIAFTDIQSSTQLWEGCPDGMKRGLEIHNTVIRRVINAVDGYEVKTIGDAFMVAFLTPRNAFEFALRVQEGLVEAEWPNNLLESHRLCLPTGGGGGESGRLWAGPRVRIGVHWGDVNPEKNPITGRCDFFGNAVNKAARVEAASVGGCSAVTEELLDKLTEREKKAFADVMYIPLGKVPLKGVSADNLSELTLVLPGSLSGRRDTAQVALAMRAQDAGDAPLVKTGRRTSAAALLAKAIGTPSVVSSRRPVADAFRGSMATVIAVDMNCSFLMQRDELGAAVDAYFVPLIQIVQRTEGVLQSVVGGRCLLSWNVGRPCGLHRVQALNFLADIQTAGVRFGDRLDGGPWNGLMSCGVASGWCVAGRTGTEKQKNMVVYGGALELAHHAVDVARVHGMFAVATAMVNACGVYDEQSARDAFRLVDSRPCSRYAQGQSFRLGPGVGMETVEFYEVDVDLLIEGKGTWGFDIPASAPGSTWGPTFAARAREVFLMHGDGAEGRAETLAALRATIDEVKKQQTCPVCRGGMVAIHCRSCQKSLCAGCARDCMLHELEGLAEASLNGLMYLEQNLSALSNPGEDATLGLRPISLEMCLTQQPKALWLGCRDVQTTGHPSPLPHGSFDTPVAMPLLNALSVDDRAGAKQSASPAGRSSISSIHGVTLSVSMDDEGERGQLSTGPTGSPSPSRVSAVSPANLPGVHVV